MRQVLFFILIVVLSLSCEDKRPTDPSLNQNKTNTKHQQHSPEPRKKEVKVQKINDQNVRDTLLSYGVNNPETKIVFHTDKGVINARLFKDTPLHRANFVMLAKAGCFDNTVFTRVAIDFMAQAGVTYDEQNVKLRNGIGKFTIPNEILPHHFHRKGALAAARRYVSNPSKRSDPYAFYFVDGTTYNRATLDKYAVENNYSYSKEQLDYYRSNVGAAHIDGQHTVFGQVTAGFDVISEITHVKTDGRDWPITDIYIRRVEVYE
ncbi:MAG: peptidylprolyl isomerase [Vicingaceae bacterium]